VIGVVTYNLTATAFSDSPKDNKIEGFANAIVVE
jgi:hypothetical protein